MKIELVDTHAHLDFPQFEHDRADVISRAREVDVTTIITIGVDLATSRAAVALAEAYDGVFAAIGVHPHDAKGIDERMLSEFDAVAQHNRVVAIGEIGLDYYRDLSPWEQQRHLFRTFLKKARAAQLPVIIHTRNAWEDMMRMLRECWQDGSSGVMHCFSGDRHCAAELLEMGFYLSFTGVITFKNSTAVRVLSDIPLERLLLETDCPYMAPEPHRGRRNEPAYLRLIASKIADVKRLSLAEVAQVTTGNARTLFRI